jgi:glycopeptide antibiotics resistance protein
LPKNKAKIDKRWWFVVACALIGTILINELPNFHPEKYLGLTYSWQLDMIMHGGYFCMLTIFLRMTVFAKTNGIALFSILFLASLGLELLQTWIPKRSSTVFDVVSNSIGIVLGIAMSVLIINIKRKAKLFNAN